MKAGERPVRIQIGIRSNRQRLDNSHGIDPHEDPFGEVKAVFSPDAITVRIADFSILLGDFHPALPLGRETRYGRKGPLLFEHYFFRDAEAKKQQKNEEEYHPSAGQAITVLSHSRHRPTHE